MAAPEAAWNRVDVPWPAGSSAVAVAAQHPAGPRLGCRVARPGWGGEERGHRSRWAARRAGEGEAYPGRAECGAGGARGERRCARWSLSAARSQ